MVIWQRNVICFVTYKFTGTSDINWLIKLLCLSSTIYSLKIYSGEQFNLNCTGTENKLWLYCIYFILIRSISSGAMFVNSCLSEYPQKAIWKHTNPRRARCCLQCYLCHCAAYGYVKVRGHCSGVRVTQHFMFQTEPMLTVSASFFYLHILQIEV